MRVLRGHSEWLGLIDHSGPFISLPVLQKVFPQGLDGLKKDLGREVRKTYREWCDVSQVQDKTAADTVWTRSVLTNILEYPSDLLAEGPAIPAAISSRVPEFHEVIRPDLVLMTPQGRDGAGQPRILIQTYSRETNLDKTLPDKPWKESPVGRMTFLLRATNVKLGLVTNGEEWTLVYAPVGETSSVATWHSALWLDEPTTLQAFVAIVGVRRLIGVADSETLEALFADSSNYQQEVTEQLGLQVRRSIEILVQQLDRANRERQDKLLSGVSESEVYEASVTFMMRLVFLFFAEENRLLPIDDELYQSFYAASTILEQLREMADKGGEELLERQADAYPRLLATFRGVHGGIEHDNLMIPPYGGHLFDPDRFPFLEGRTKGNSWRSDRAKPLPIHNRTVLHLLESLQTLEDRKLKEKRRLSFRSLDIEQIGHVYEGLLDHTVRKALSPVVSLKTSGGLEGDEPEVTIAQLSTWKKSGEKEFVDKLKEITELSDKAIQKNIAQRLSPEDEQRLSISCNNDSELISELRDFVGLIRRDNTDLPVVVPSGGFYVTSGTDRRSTGTHYTQRSLTEPIVQHTLEPLVYIGVAEGTERESWKLKSPKELLDLKICDLACGSGAFLVQACRYLSQRLVEAWSEIEKNKPGQFIISPDGDTAKIVPISSYIPRSVDERLILARRLVVERCLYGVDRNHLAVEMAKLSLWLITLDKNRPFTFLDHHIKSGDSLVGVTSVAQVEHFSLDADSDPWIKQRSSYIQGIAQASVASATALYKEIGATPVLEIRDSERKEKIFADAQNSTAELRVLADLLVGTTMAAGEVRGSKFFERANVYYGQFCDVFEKKIQGEKRTLAMKQLKEAAQKLLDENAPESQKPRRTFHWVLEFPEVFEGRNGFDAIVGNPPFVGGKKITGNLGTDYRDYCVANLGFGKKGHADLCAYFFLRVGSLLDGGGTAGLIATNTISQGDTRDVGLDQFEHSGLCIYRAISSQPWFGSANLEVALVWFRRGTWNSSLILDNHETDGISSYLRVPGKTKGSAHRLKANGEKSFVGAYVLGMGFVLSPDEAKMLIRKNSRNREVLFPYMNGEDLNQRSDQSASRWVINFRDWSLEKAEEYPDCIEILRNKVKPERERRKPNGDFVLRKPLPQKWWIFAEKQSALYKAISGDEFVMVRARIANIHSVALVANDRVFNEKTVVFVDVPFSVMQSTIHEIWAREHSSTLRKDMQYTPSDCFDTFPFPNLAALSDSQASEYREHRQSVMFNRKEGLTSTYNRFHNAAEKSSDIVKLRELHISMDRIVANAYGWTDLKLLYDFHPTKQGIRFTFDDHIRSEVLDRLLALNQAYFRDEVAAGLHVKTGSDNGGKSRKGASSKVDSRQAQLF